MSALYAALKIYYFLPILSGLIGISVYSCGELRKAASERKINMKKLVVILTIAIMLFATQEQRAEHLAMLDASQNVASEQTEKVSETNTEQVEKITEPTCEPVSTENEIVTKERPAVQTPMKECVEETERQQAAKPEKTVECVDKGNQSLAEYKPQPSGQTNPFENAPPAEIVDQPVEELIGEGEDRPGEGKHF